MAARPFWKGYMKLSLVTCPVAMTSATNSEEEKRRGSHVAETAGTGNRSRRATMSTLTTGKPVSRGRRGQGLMRAARTSTSCLEDEEVGIRSRLRAPAPSTSRVSSRRRASTGSWYDTPYYLNAGRSDRRGGRLRHSRRDAFDRDDRGLAARAEPPRTGGYPETPGQRNCALDVALRR